MADNLRLELDHLPPSSQRPRIVIDTRAPYRDDPEDSGFEDICEEEADAKEPPKYQPMFEYLRQRSASYPPPQTLNQISIQEPYRDEPFVVTIDSNQTSYSDSEADEPPPPSYEHLCRQNEMELEALMNEMDIDGTPVEQTEELIKWVVAMLLVGLTVAGVGTAFNWGREKGCGWGGAC